jgi:hypothetical protein
MGKQPRDKDGLSPKEARAAALRAQGWSQAQAYRHAFNARELERSTLDSRASVVFKRPAMEKRVRSLLDAANIQDIDSVGRAFADLQEDLAEAKADRNWTAVAALGRLRLQVLGMLKENVALTVEQRTDDDSLIARLAGDDKDLAESLRRRLGKEGFDA